jgi:two-component system, cell cycle response regulator
VSKRIILVEMGEGASVLAERLRMQGYAVVAANDPAEGARLALGDPPAAVIADLWMPGISGVQLCRLLKAEPATENVPVVLRGPEGQRNRFWAERAGAAAYVVKGRMGDLVRALASAIAAAPEGETFFTSFSSGHQEIHERIAAHLDAALFESVLASEVRALGTCGAFDRLFDLFSQFVARVASYRWLAVSTLQPPRIGLHTNPKSAERALREARAAVGIASEALTVLVEDEDAFDDENGPEPIIHPIRLGDIAIGNLALATRHPMHSQDAALASVIARELAGPIRMATLVEESQHMARVDALTGLLNRRAFITALEVEMERATRYGQVLSVFMLDVDHFKAINDRWGHGSGDAVLSKLGALLPATLRRPDSVARWGGEEFVGALPCTNLDGAVLAAERVRTAIERMNVSDAGGSAIPVTASLGVAQIAAGDTVDSLVDRADRAMYAAKTGGRNRVVSAGEVAPVDGQSAVAVVPPTDRDDAA